MKSKQGKKDQMEMTRFKKYICLRLFLLLRLRFKAKLFGLCAKEDFFWHALERNKVYYFTNLLPPLKIFLYNIRNLPFGALFESHRCK